MLKLGFAKNKNVFIYDFGTKLNLSLHRKKRKDTNLVYNYKMHILKR